MAACYTSSIPSNVATAGYTYPVNVESLLRSKVDPYSTERVFANSAIPALSTPFVNAGAIPTPFEPRVNAFAASPVERCVETGYVYGAECGAQLAQIVCARLNAVVGYEVAARIAAQWCSEVCAKIASGLAVRLVNGWPVEQCARWCYSFGAERGVELGAVIAQRLGCYPLTELAARICSTVFADICEKLCYVVASRVNETARFGGYPTGYPTTFGGRFNTPAWTGIFPTSSFPNTWSTPNSWTNAWGRPELYNYSPYNNDKLYNVAFRPSSAVELYSLTNPIRIVDIEGNRQLCLCFELKGYKPEEVTVTLNKAERAVVVEAAHDVKEGKEHAVARKYSRKFVLPESLAKIDLTKVELKSYLSPEGYLAVECPLPKMTTEEIAKTPIMSELYAKMPFYGYNAINNTFGACPYPTSELINNVKPVTVKTA